MEQKAQATWNQKNSIVVAWILNYIELNVGLCLQNFKSASDMWNRLKELYHQVNKAGKILSWY